MKTAKGAWIARPFSCGIKHRKSTYPVTRTLGTTMSPWHAVDIPRPVDLMRCNNRGTIAQSTVLTPRLALRRPRKEVLGHTEVANVIFSNRPVAR